MRAGQSKFSVAETLSCLWILAATAWYGWQFRSLLRFLLARFLQEP